jgi:uncharacterized protein (TIGR02217 family)
MGHLATTLPNEIETGATQVRDYQTQIVTTDGGHERRNNRWRTPLRRYEADYSALERDGATHAAVVALFDEAEGSLHTFNFQDWTDGSGSLRRVRFDGPLELTGIAEHLDQVTIRLVEVRS